MDYKSEALSRHRLSLLLAVLGWSQTGSSVALIWVVGKVITMASERQMPYLTNAERRVSEETDTLSAEQEALGAFHNRLQNRAPLPVKTSKEATPGGVASQSIPVENIVIDAYQETFMKLPHYDAEYGESAIESIREEFGEEVAALVASRSGIAHDTAARAALEGITKREVILERLAVEEDQIQTMQTEFGELHNRLDSIQMSDSTRSEPKLDHQLDHTDECEQLDGIEDTCEALLADRQRVLREHDAQLSHNEFGLADFLYHPLEVDFPVLATLGTICNRLDSPR